MKNTIKNVLLNPREAIQELIKTDQRKMVFLIAGIVGYFFWLDKCFAEHFGDGLSMPLILAISLLGSVAEIGEIYWNAAFLYLMGKWLKGQATMRHIRAALAWSRVPMVFGAFFWFVVILIFGPKIFTSQVVGVRDTSLYKISLISFSVYWIIGLIVTLVNFFRMLSQVQKFSILKAIANALLAILIYVGIILIIGLAMVFL